MSFWSHPLNVNGYYLFGSRPLWLYNLHPVTINLLLSLISVLLATFSAAATTPTPTLVTTPSAAPSSTAANLTTTGLPGNTVTMAMTLTQTGINMISPMSHSNGNTGECGFTIIIFPLYKCTCNTHVEHLIHIVVTEKFNSWSPVMIKHSYS